MRIKDKNHLGLVLSGGGVKAAAFHIGVCLALQERGFNFTGGFKSKRDQIDNSHKKNGSKTFKTYVGSSAGSVITTYLACGYDLSSIIEAFTPNNDLTPKKSSLYLRPLTYKDLFKVNFQPRSFLKFLTGFLTENPLITGGLEVQIKKAFKFNGFFTTENLEKYFNSFICEKNSFHDLHAQLFIIATQLNHSRKVVFGPFNESTKNSKIEYADYAQISQAVAASTSLPPIFAPYPIKNKNEKEIYFFDGEIRDTLSTHVASDNGCDFIIASYSIQPYHFHPEMGSLHDYGVPMIINQALYQLIQQKISSSLSHTRTINSIIKTVDGYLREQNFEKEKREQLVEIIIKKANIKTNVTTVYIHPSPHDYQMFFADHFSLNSEILSQIMKTGFRAAMTALRPYQF